MSYNTDLQTNNSSLQSILDTINNLPEAGSGGSGGVGLTTCTVTIMSESESTIYYVSANNDGSVSYDTLEHPGVFSTQTIITLSNTLIVVKSNYTYVNSAYAQGASVERVFPSEVHILTGSSEEAYIQIQNLDQGGGN